MFDKYKPHLEKLKEHTKPILEHARPVVIYVYNRRGRFSALGTCVALYPLLRRPNHTWSEFEKDFRMYDNLSKKK